MGEMLTTIAWGIVDGATGVLLAGRNIAVNRLGVGDYELVLPDDGGVDDLEMMITVQGRSFNFLRFFLAESTNDFTKRVQVFSTAGLPADGEFYFEIKRLNIL